MANSLSIILLYLTNNFGAACSSGAGGNILEFPTWYQFLSSQTIDGDCVPQIDNLTDIWLIALAILDILIKVGAIFAMAMIIWGGIRYIMSQGNPDSVKAAKDTLLNAIIGLLIAIISAGVVRLVAGAFS